MIDTTRSITVRLAVVVVALCTSGTLWAQSSTVTSPAPPEEIQSLIERGQGAVLESRVGREPNVAQLHWLAQAFANAGGRAKQKDARDQAFEKASTYYERWIDRLDQQQALIAAKHTVARVQARAEYARMIVNQWCGRALDEHQITSGLRTDFEELARRYSVAVEQFEEARELLRPLADTLNEREDQYLYLGIFDAIRNGRLDITFGRSWAQTYLAMMLPEDEDARRAHYQAAAKGFRELLDSPFVGRMLSQCYLGLGLALGGLEQFEEAREALDRASQGGASRALELRVRYEKAELLLEQGHFDEARQLLRPMVEQDLSQLPPEARPAMFYFNLARIRYANSYFQEARAIRAAAKTSGSTLSRLREARRVQESGLRQFRGYALQEGGSWPALAQLYVTASIDASTDLDELTPIELLYTARDFAAQKQSDVAIERLKNAAAREVAPPELYAEILFELGSLQYRTRRIRAAADTFAKIATEVPQTSKSRQAATYAYQLSAELANETGAAEDYRQLADVLRALLERYPQHPQREEAAWFLPIALQNAGEYEAAAQQFANVADDSPHAAEARFRRLVCQRLAAQSSGTAEPAALRTLAQQFADFAKRETEWIPEALLNAAELLATESVADYERAATLVEELRQKDISNDLRGRALGIQLKAYHGLARYDAAARLLDEFLAKVDPEEAGNVLAALAQGMQQEVTRRRESGDDAAARKLARQAIGTFESLREWVAADEQRQTFALFVQRGLAQMHLLAGDIAQAEQVVTEALAEHPKNGSLRRLQAQVLTAKVAQASAPSQALLGEAMAAWGKLLSEPGLKAQQPRLYWEARYHYLELLLQTGEAQQVAQAIRQQRVWWPELGGPTWRPKFEQLLATAERESGAASPAAADGD